ncbi:hypothetical protein [Nitrospirillum pindoramense]|uniref:hypothetical protein n=1 Tax=Nitrospirillum amazonense TaxID=28077 RepID=UPI0011A7632A|nr:hypothetical protein [Nitrospirillum amazonense]
MSTLAGMAALAVSLSAPLQALLDEFAKQAPPQQTAQVMEAITASPSLAAELSALAADGLLKGFGIDTAGRLNKFEAGVREGKILFTPTFLGDVASTRPFDVVEADSIRPNNTTFVLGHLAAHTKIPSPEPRAPDGTARDLPTFIMLKMTDEATADLQGWNDMVEAAQVANGGKALTVPQVGYLMMSLRYRAVFFNAMRSQDRKITFAPDGRIDPTPENILALGAALTKTNVFDFD